MSPYSRTLSVATAALPPLLLLLLMTLLLHQSPARSAEAHTIEAPTAAPPPPTCGEFCADAPEPRKDALRLGERLPGDDLVETFHFERNGSLFRVLDELKTFEGDRVSRITQVRVYDPTAVGTGATAQHVTGGVNAVFVTLRFSSVRSGSIDFYVDIYAKR